MLDGIYSMTFRGRADWGIGMLILQNGAITGADAGGVLYDGSYTDGAETVEFNFTMTVPPGATPVQGTPAQPNQYTITTSVKIPRHALDDGHPILMRLPLGPVNVIFRRLRPLST